LLIGAQWLSVACLNIRLVCQVLLDLIKDDLLLMLAKPLNIIDGRRREGNTKHLLPISLVLQRAAIDRSR
jgi:hypothetical protein